jgi:hypothetical protein
MVKVLMGLAVATIASSVLASQGGSIQTALEDPKFLSKIGISQPVHDCANKALAGKTVPELKNFVSSLADADASNLTADQQAMVECVKLDPLGVIGTDEEWVNKYIQADLATYGQKSGQ